MKVEDAFWVNVDKSGGCWLWTGKTGHGYGIFNFAGESLGAHRVSWEIVNGPIPEDDSHHKTMHVLHRCDVKRCVNPAHLFLGTHKDNMRDLAIKGLSKGLVKGQSGRWVDVPDQDYSNRARYWLRKRLNHRRVLMKDGLDCAAPKTLSNFILGKSDMTINKLDQIATELGTTVHAMLRRIPNE